MNAILIVLISILILVVVYLVKKTGAQTRLELFTPIAKKYNAEYQPEEILQGDHLFVPYRDNDLVIKLRTRQYTKPTGDPDHTRNVRVRILTAELELDKAHLPLISLATDSFFKKIVSFDNEDRVHTGDEKFDKRYVIESADPNLVKKLFPEETRKKLTAGHIKHAEFLMNEDHFNMEVVLSDIELSHPDMGKRIEEFIDLAIFFLERAWQ